MTEPAYSATPFTVAASVQRGLFTSSRCRCCHLQATVGAGLPIISTLKNLIETGDKIISIEGILSGTLSSIFNTFKPGIAFSEVVRQAKDQGYTEPDPREDLSGADRPGTSIAKTASWVQPQSVIMTLESKALNHCFTPSL